MIGSVDAETVNEVSAELSRTVRRLGLPEKLLVVHQFRVDMISDRSTLATGHDELALLIHGDGFGTPRQKLETWRRLRAEPLPGAWWGWKNFYAEDQPTVSPARTADIGPSPRVLSSQ